MGTNKEIISGQWELEADYQAFIVGKVDNPIHWIYLYLVYCAVCFVNTYSITGKKFICWITLSALWTTEPEIQENLGNQGAIIYNFELGLLKE